MMHYPAKVAYIYTGTSKKIEYGEKVTFFLVTFLYYGLM